MANRSARAPRQGELLEPLGEGGPIAAFLKKNPAGGMHHVCYEVADIDSAMTELKRSNPPQPPPLLPPLLTTLAARCAGTMSGH